MKLIIRNRIKYYRRWCRISQRELGKILGIDSTLVCKLERGKTIPTLELAFRIARCFDKKLEQIFWLEDKE